MGGDFSERGEGLFPMGGALLELETVAAAAASPPPDRPSTRSMVQPITKIIFFIDGFQRYIEVYGDVI